MNPNQIYQLRQDMGWSQADMGRYLGFTATAVRKWEKGLSTPSDPVKGILIQLRTQLDQRKEQQKKEFINGLAAVAITGGIVSFIAYIFRD